MTVSSRSVQKRLIMKTPRGDVCRSRTYYSLGVERRPRLNGVFRMSSRRKRRTRLNERQGLADIDRMRDDCFVSRVGNVNQLPRQLLPAVVYFQHMK